LQAQDDSDRSLLRLSLIEEFAMRLDHAGDFRCCLQTPAWALLKIEHRPFRRFGALEPCVQKPENHAIRTGTNAGPHPLRNVIGRGVHWLARAINIVAAL